MRKSLKANRAHGPKELHWTPVHGVRLEKPITPTLISSVTITSCFRSYVVSCASFFEVIRMHILLLAWSGLSAEACGTTSRAKRTLSQRAKFPAITTNTGLIFCECRRNERRKLGPIGRPLAKVLWHWSRGVNYFAGFKKCTNSLFWELETINKFNITTMNVLTNWEF